MDQEKLIAENLSRDILKIARSAKSEEELRIGVEKLLEPALKILGIDFSPQYDRTIIKGKPDAVYGHVTIEYEKPGKLGTTAGLNETTSQLAQYLSEVATQYGKREDALKKTIGVSLDGFQILFLRHKGAKIGAGFFSLKEGFRIGDFQVFGPFPVTRESISLFLIYLRSLSRKLLTPEALADEFGPKGNIARKLIDAFYNKLKDTTDPQIQTFFSEWERIFGIIYGKDVIRERDEISELSRFYGLEGAIDFKPFLFSVHTYYGLLMKLLAVELASLQNSSLISSFVGNLLVLPEKELKDKLIELEEGGLFYQLGIKNFLEGDFFRWYLSGWNEDIADGIREMARSLSQFEPATTTLEPEATRDLLKKLYQYLLPKKLRHDLGEYYTPDWLADRLLNQVGYDGNPERRLIDPGCGSGTFLVLAIKRVRDFAERELLEPKSVVEAILKNIVGFDLNPLAVIAARTNYLLALGDLIRHLRPIEIPVYMCDSILTPSRHAEKIGRLLPETKKGYKLSSGVGDFYIPEEVINKEKMEILTTLLEECIRGAYSEEEFLERVQRSLDIRHNETKEQLIELYKKVLMLEREGKNGLWMRFLKNAFAPVFVGKFDFVVGNPPWVRWGYLSSEYRDATKNLWQNYGLFSLKGYEARLGAGEKDFSMLFLYASTDHYLKKKGKLGFVITQTVFKTKGAGEGFRRFRLGDRDELKVIHVDDLVELQPFEGAANRTSVLILQKGLPTKYPVPYTLWRKKKGSQIILDLSLNEVIQKTKRIHLYANPLRAEQPASPWVTLRSKALRALKNIMQKGDYTAYRGAETDPYGVYQVKILVRNPNDTVIIENLYDAGKKKIGKVQEAIESDFIYPFLRGKDVEQWKTEPSIFVVLVQDPNKRAGYDEKWMKMNYPKTYSYLKKFESILRNRASRVARELAEKGPFYSMFGIGLYTFSPWKAVWQRMAKELKTAVVSTYYLPEIGEKIVIPGGTTAFIPAANSEEAHYLCGLLNSAICKLAVKSFSAPGRGFGAPSILNNLFLPKYHSDFFIHQNLSQLSQKAHELAARGEETKAELKMVEDEIDQKAAQLWGITEEELNDIKSSLRELG